MTHDSHLRPLFGSVRLTCRVVQERDVAVLIFGGGGRGGRRVGAAVPRVVAAARRRPHPRHGTASPRARPHRALLVRVCEVVRQTGTRLVFSAADCLYTTFFLQIIFNALFNVNTVSGDIYATVFNDNFNIFFWLVNRLNFNI